MHPFQPCVLGFVHVAIWIFLFFFFFVIHLLRSCVLLLQMDAVEDFVRESIFGTWGSLKRAFTVCDTNGDGQISPSEFKLALKDVFGLNLTPLEVVALLARFDADRDGRSVRGPKRNDVSCIACCVMRAAAVQTYDFLCLTESVLRSSKISWRTD